MAVVVLGCRLESSKLRPELQGRMDVGIEVFERIDAEYLVVSGARTNPDVPHSESDLMARYAIANGVNPDDVVAEDRARDTVGNAYFARLLLEGTDVSTINVVTSCYHAERSRFIFEQCFGADYHIRAADCYEAADPVPEFIEQEKIDYARGFFESVPIGDVAQVRQRLVDAHPFYDDSYLEASAPEIR